MTAGALTRDDVLARLMERFHQRHPHATDFSGLVVIDPAAT
jgi:hypothetical protein